ncbi:ABC transporter permease [Mesorhizobium sp. IMUNJ 23033]|uniref:ABC transporter permease n=1 Tax=Mesorhizobium sp. IMUNJ 23033 TaxID=3378039 RepID=UPI00384D3CC4
MLTLMLRRLMGALFAFLFASVVVFVCLQALPGDACTAMLGQQQGDALALARCRGELGLDQAGVLRFAHWLGSLLRGDFGIALSRGQSVADILGPRLRNTALLGGAAALVGIPLAIVLGVVAGLRRDRPSDLAISGIALFAMTVPEFVSATLLIYVFAIWLRWLPAVTVIPPSAPIGEFLPNIVLPVVTLGLVMTAHIMRIARTSVIEVMASDYVEAARLRGLPMLPLLLRHVLPNALIPTLNLAALTLAWLLGGVVIIEQVFNYPGVGTLMIQAIHDRDLALIQTITLMFVVTYIAVNLLADLLALALDPRLRSQVR